MKKHLTLLLFVVLGLMATAQQTNVLDQLKADPPLPTDTYPYYKWSDFRRFYTDRCKSHSNP